MVATLDFASSAGYSEKIFYELHNIDTLAAHWYKIDLCRLACLYSLHLGENDCRAPIRPLLLPSLHVFHFFQFPV